MKKVTLLDLAETTGLSVSTISRVLSGSAGQNRISDATRDLVFKEARKLGYLKHNVLLNPNATKSNIIGLLLPSVANPYFAEMASKLILELDMVGYTTIIADTMEDEQKFVSSLKSMIARQVDGIIAAPCGNDPSFVLEMIDKNLPLVLIDRYYEGTQLSYVTTNNYQGGLDATRYLISRGHRTIACIQGSDDSMPCRERVRGYLDGMRESSLQDYSLVVGDDFSVRCGYEQTQRLLQSDHVPTAIFTLSNTIMLGTLNAMREAGKRIPDDIAVLSFDNNTFMDYMTPTITRISQPLDDMAKLSVKMLLEKIAGNTQTNSHLLLTPTFVQGESA